MKEFAENNRILLELLDLWEPRLLSLSEEVIKWPPEQSEPHN